MYEFLKRFKQKIKPNDRGFQITGDYINAKIVQAYLRSFFVRAREAR